MTRGQHTLCGVEGSDERETTTRRIAWVICAQIRRFHGVLTINEANSVAALR